MWGLTRKLSDKQIQGLAAYFSKQKNVPDAASGGDLSAGKRIFETGVPEKNIPACKTCHGPSAEGAGQFPRLAGQHADYLVKQLSVFQRTNERPEGAIMKTVAHDLTRANMVSVAAYLSTL